MEKEWNGGGESEYNVETKVVHGEGGDAGAGMAGDGAEAQGASFLVGTFPDRFAVLNAHWTSRSRAAGRPLSDTDCAMMANIRSDLIIPQFLAIRARLC